MHQPGSILLVSCYELGHQPFAIASPAAFLKRAGYSPNLLDLAVSDFDETQVALADFVGISVPMHTALRLGVRAAKRIRTINPNCHICFYGLYASLNSKFLLEQLADSVIGGEFEGPLVELIKVISNDRPSCVRNFEIDGVSLSGRIRAPYLQRLAFTAPSYEGLPPVEQYAQLAHDGTHRPAGYVEASRGCLHRCLHCPIPPIYDGRFFVVPQAVVLESIRDLVESGATHITFGDPDFLNGPGHSLRLVRAMHQEFPQLTFDFTAKVEHLLKHRSLLPEFAQAGCLFVISAFESLSDDVLKNLNKGHSREDIHAVLEVFRNVGITLRPTWMPFTPWTTLDDYIDLLEFVRREHLIQNIDPVQYSIRLLVPPGSMLLQHDDMTAFLGPLDQTNFAYRWTHPDPRMDELQENVTRTVEQAIDSKEGTAEIFEGVRGLAYAARGERAIPFLPDFVPLLEPPRLTESWFC
ncbi:MAG: CUAEP/CCAEP-tail radical SAM protein [Pyrinomonadaceae bacterium]